MTVDIEITIEVPIECDLDVAFKSNEWSAAQLHSIGFQKMEGPIQSYSYFKFQPNFKKCVANNETIKLPKTRDYPYVVIIVR